MATQWGCSNLSWTRGLEYVLSDRPALDAFRDWLINNESPQPLDLHFAMSAYDRMAAEKHSRTGELARSIYQKYLSLRTGCCVFIPSKIRQEVGMRVKSLGSIPDPHIFSSVKPYVDAFLRRQHEQFVCSEEFIDAFNQFSLVESGFYLGTSQKRKKAPPQLTAETLLRSRQDREHTLGESSVERMYPASGIKQPYVCHATTSQNDSAVSSSFSSDANGHRPTRLRSIREEHLRGNPTTYVIPRVENHSKNEGQQFDHSTEEGRRIFATILCKKLNREQTCRRRNDEIERQLRDIEDRKCTARELISTADAVEVDDEDDVERYVERMREDSLKASANRTPHTNTLSPRPFSPEREKSKSGVMSSSVYDYPKFNHFAPPPLPNVFNNSNYYKERSLNRTAPIYDSSGIESMAPSSFSDGSRHSRHVTTALATPRRAKKSCHSQLITISYKGSDGVPVVAHVPALNGFITFKEFRRYFSISSHANVQFFFKSACEDGSAPYQLLLVNDDSTHLPVFQGRVAAEIKHISPE